MTDTSPLSPMPSSSRPHVVVIGATSAVAQAAIRLWAQRGVRLSLVARNASELERIAADAHVRGADVSSHVGNACDRAFLISMQTQIVDADIALIAHGTLTDSARVEGDLDYLASGIDDNFTSAALWAQAFATHMSARKHGVIAVISSVAGDRGRNSNHAYGAAKAGLNAFCSGLRARLYERGVHVLTVKPGFIDSPMTAHIEKKGALWANPEQIAKGILRGIDKRRNVIYLPGFWWLIMAIVRTIPEPIFKRLKF